MKDYDVVCEIDKLGLSTNDAMFVAVFIILKKLLLIDPNNKLVRLELKRYEEGQRYLLIKLANESIAAEGEQWPLKKYIKRLEDRFGKENKINDNT